ncbi:MAG: hypothetical protein D6786_03850, partial [Gammaproteobacteria bacterium]
PLAPAPARRQGGAALLLFMLIVVIGASYMLLSRLSASSLRVQSTADSVNALRIAKEALIGYAASYPDQYGGTNPSAGPGHLPCPDTDGNGSPDTPCGPGALKWLPTKILGLENLRDGSGARLWYAVADGFRNNPITTPLNSAIVNSFPASKFLGVDGAGDIVAVILAPGAPLDSQDRDTGPDSVGNYLEGENSNGDTTYSARVAGGNDLLTVITRAELLTAVEQRVLNEVRNKLADYYQNSDSDPAKRYYPYAALLGSQSPDRVGWENLRKGFLPIDPGEGDCECKIKLETIGLSQFRSIECKCKAKAGNSGNKVFVLDSPYFNSTEDNCSLTGSTCTCDLPPGQEGKCLTTPLPYPGAIPDIDVTIQKGIFTKEESGCTGSRTAVCSCSGGSTDGKCKAKVAEQGNPALGFLDWFTANQWDQLVYYALASGCQEKGTSGCASSLLTVGTLNDVGAVAIATGPELGSTNCNGTASHDQQGKRPSQDVCDYLDSQENTDSDDVYTDRSTPITGNYWDRIRIVRP